MRLRPGKFQTAAAGNSKESTIGTTLGNVRMQREERRTRRIYPQPLNPLPNTKEATPAEKARTGSIQLVPHELTTTERLLEARRKRQQTEALDKQEQKK